MLDNKYHGGFSSQAEEMTVAKTTPRSSADDGHVETSLCINGHTLIAVTSANVSADIYKAQVRASIPEADRYLVIPSNSPAINDFSTGQDGVRENESAGRLILNTNVKLAQRSVVSPSWYTRLARAFRLGGAGARKPDANMVSFFNAYKSNTVIKINSDTPLSFDLTKGTDYYRRMITNASHVCDSSLIPADAANYWHKHKEIGPDGFAVLERGYGYKPECTHLGQRCHYHGMGNVHEWVDAALNVADELSAPSAQFMTWVLPIIHQTIDVCSKFSATDKVLVTAITKDYDCSRAWKLASGFDGAIIYTDDENIEYGKQWKNRHYIVVDKYISGRTHSALRLFPGYFSNTRAKFVCANVQTTNLPRAHQELWDVPYKHFTSCSFAWHPSNCSAIVMEGGSLTQWAKGLALMEVFGPVYGVDEIMYLYEPVIVQLLQLSDRTRLNNVFAFRDLKATLTYNVVFWEQGVKACFTVGRYLRSSIVHLAKIEQALAGRTVCNIPLENTELKRLSKYTGKMIITTGHQFTNPWWPESISPLALRFGVITIFTFGTRGDTMPLLGLAKTLVADGLLVHVHHVLTKEEGELMLTSVEHGEGHKYLNWLNEGLDCVQACKGIKLAPYVIADTEAITYGLAPPSHVARPLRGGILFYLEPLVTAYFANVGNNINVGAYKQRGWLPRYIVDSFWLGARNTGEFEHAVIKGSSSIPIPPRYADWQVVPTGQDHRVVLPRYKKVAYIPTAGLSQTVALAGCASEGIDVSEYGGGAPDRRVRRLDDPAMKSTVNNTTDPRLVIAALGLVDTKGIKVYLTNNYNNKYTPDVAIFFVRLWRLIMWWPINANLKYIWLALTILANAFWFRRARIVETGNPLITIISTLVLNGRATKYESAMVLFLGALYTWWRREYNFSLWWSIKTLVKHSLRARLHWSWVLLSIWLPPIIIILVSPWSIPLLDAFRATVVKCTRAALHIYWSRDNKADVYFEARSVGQGFLPLYHTSLICPALAQRYEGVYPGLSGWGKDFSLTHIDGGFTDGAITVPTAISVKDFKNLKTRSARYGIFWTCQTGLIHQLGGSSWKLGGPVFLLFWLMLYFSVLMSFGILFVALIINSITLIPADILGQHPTDLFPILKSLYEDFDLDLGRPEAETEGWIMGMYDWAVAVTSRLGNTTHSIQQYNPNDYNLAAAELVCQEICDLPEFAGTKLMLFDGYNYPKKDKLLKQLVDISDWRMVCDLVAEQLELRYSSISKQERAERITRIRQALHAVKYKFTVDYKVSFDNANEEMQGFLTEPEIDVLLSDLQPRRFSPNISRVNDESFTCFINVLTPWADEPAGMVYRPFDWKVHQKLADFETIFSDHEVNVLSNGSVFPVLDSDPKDYTELFKAMAWSVPHLKGQSRVGADYKAWYLRHRHYWTVELQLDAKLFDAWFTPSGDLFSLEDAMIELIIALRPLGLKAVDKQCCRAFLDRDWTHIDNVLGIQRRVELTTFMVYLSKSDFEREYIAQAHVDNLHNAMTNYGLLPLPVNIDIDIDDFAPTTSHLPGLVMINNANTHRAYDAPFCDWSYEALAIFAELSRNNSPPDLNDDEVRSRVQFELNSGLRENLMLLLPVTARGIPETPDHSLEAYAELGGAIVADLISIGVTSPIAIAATSHTLHAAALEVLRQGKDNSSKARMNLYTRLIENRPTGGVNLSSILECFSRLQAFCTKIGMSTVFLESFRKLITTVTIKVEEVLRKLGNLFDETITLILNSVTHLFDEAIDIFADLIRGTAPNLSRKAKSVWAFLFPDVSPVLSPAEYFALTLPEMDVPEREPFEIQLGKLVDTLNKHAPEGKRINKEPGCRPLRFPRQFRVADKHELDDTLFKGTLIELPQWRAALEQYSSKFAFKQGIDGAFLASQEHEYASLLRYSGALPEVTQGVKAIVFDAAEAMFNEFPEMFAEMRPSTVEAAFNNLVTKYSPRLPFITNYRSVRDLFEDGFYRTVIRTAKEYLAAGEHPGELYDSFVKRQVVSRAKAEGFVRTITAQDIISYAIALVPSLERNKRIPPENFRWGAGTPMTEGGMMNDALALLELQRSGGHIFGADETNYDANAHPVFIRDGLSYLAELGFKTHTNGQALASILKSHYKAMNKSWIYDLHYQFVIGKDKGGATGEVSVSWDNTMSKMMKDITCWCIVKSKPASEFFKTNILLLTSDDELWGSTDLTAAEAQQICDVSWKYFGQATRIETSFGELKDQEYLSKLFDTDFPTHEYINYGLPVPQIRIRTNPERLLMRRSAFRSDKGGKPAFEFATYQLQRTIGHTQLLAHYPELYHDLSCEFMQEVDGLLEGTGHSWKVGVSREGRYTKISLIPGRSKSTKLDALVKQLSRALRFPSYKEVMLNWTKPTHRKPQALIDAKLAKLGPSPTIIHAMTVGLSAWRKVLRNKVIKDAVAKAQPEKEGANMAVIFTTDAHWVERYVYRCLSLKLGRAPESHEFAASIRESPYACCTDPLGFWLLTNDFDYRDMIMQDTLEMLSNRMIMISLLYIYYDAAIEKGKYIPVIGFCLELFHFWSRERTRLYALGNLVYWHSTGESSTVISGLIPKDSYAAIKQLSCITAETIPTSTVRYIPTLWMRKFAPAVVEAYVRFKTWHELSLIEPGGLADGFKNPWDDTAQRLLEAIAKGIPYHGLAAETSTGKSTSFIASLAFKCDGPIWLLVPTETLRDEYSNRFLAPLKHQILKRGVVRSDKAKLYISTYGTFLVRKDLGEVDNNSFIILDEPQEGTPEMILSWIHSKSLRRLLLTATMRKDLYLGADKILISSVKRKFKIEEIIVPGTLEQLIADASRYDEFRERGLVICNDLATVSRTITGLNTLGLAATELSSRNHMIPKTGIIVSTSIVNQGVNIYPPPTMMVCANLETVNIRGKIRVQPCSLKTMEQQNGRVGRIKDGTVLRVAHNKVGQDPLPYPTLSRFLSNPGTTQMFTQVYQLSTKLIPAPAPIGGTGVFRYVNIVNFSSRSASWNSLKAYWGLACACMSLREALLAYDSWYYSRYNEHLDYVYDTIKSCRHNALPPNAVQQLLLRKPFLVTFEDKSKFQCTGLILLDRGFATFDNTRLKSRR
jgi:hypothetical protein